MIEAKIIADSIANGVRLTTMQLRYPRFIHSEFMTHRVFSRNASSSRAIPVDEMIKQVQTNPAMPIHWGKNQPGMQADEEIEHVVEAQMTWLEASDEACLAAVDMAAMGVHKQVVNRILEPFQHIHVIVTATEWDNFFNLRIDSAAQPEIFELALQMRKAMYNSEPQELYPGEWHLPYISREEECSVGSSMLTEEQAIKCSIARCARVSYLNHDQSKPDIEKDIALADMLKEAGHMSPLEHQCTPINNLNNSEFDQDGITHIDREGKKWSGNMQGWIQYRQFI